MEHAVISWSPFGADLSIAHLRTSPPYCQPARRSGDVVTPTIVYMSSEHQAALEGLDGEDHRAKFFAGCTVVSMTFEPDGRQTSATQAAIAAASAAKLVA